MVCDGSDNLTGFLAQLSQNTIISKKKGYPKHSWDFEVFICIRDWNVLTSGIALDACFRFYWNLLLRISKPAVSSLGCWKESSFRRFFLETLSISSFKYFGSVGVQRRWRTELTFFNILAEQIRHGVVAVCNLSLSFKAPYPFKRK